MGFFEKIIEAFKGRKTTEEALDVFNIGEASIPTSLSQPITFEGEMITYPWDATTLRSLEAGDSEFISVVNSILDLIMSTKPSFQGPMAEKAKKIIKQDTIEKIVKELFVMGNVFVFVSNGRVEFVPPEFVGFKLENGSWKPYFLYKGTWDVLDEEKLVHGLVTPMVVYPWGIPMSLSIIPIIELKQSLYNVLSVVMNLNKSPLYKIKVKDITLARNIKNVFSKIRDEGGINFVVTVEDISDVEPITPPNLRIEEFASFLNERLAALGLYPDLGFFAKANRASGNVMFQIIGMRAKRLLNATKNVVDEVLEKLGIDAVLVYDMFPFEKPTMDLQSLSFFTDMGVISPDEARTILKRLGLLIEDEEGEKGEEDEEKTEDSWWFNGAIPP